MSATNNKFTPKNKNEELPLLGELLQKAKITTEIQEEVETYFTDNPPITEFTRLFVAENAEDNDLE